MDNLPVQANTMAHGEIIFYFSNNDYPLKKFD